MVIISYEICFSSLITLSATCACILVGIRCEPAWPYMLNVVTWRSTTYCLFIYSYSLVFACIFTGLLSCRVCSKGQIVLQRDNSIKLCVPAQVCWISHICKIYFSTTIHNISTAIKYLTNCFSLSLTQTILSAVVMSLNNFKSFMKLF